MAIFGYEVSNWALDIGMCIVTGTLFRVVAFVVFRTVNKKMQS